MMNQKVNLLDYNYPALRELCLQWGEKPYRAQQLMQWIHQAGLQEFSNMSNLGKTLQAKLADLAEITLPEIIACQHSKDGTRKWVIKLHCGNCVETVFIPEPKRGTLCVSSQVGCALNCSFCSTGKQGFNRNLSTAEIIGQVWLAARALSEEGGAHDRKITNVVMMGMGEPLLNYENVVIAMDIMMDDYAYGLAKRRVTLSTSGVLPELTRLRERSPVALAVSLHAPDDELRDILVPINKKYPLDQLMALCKTYFKEEGKRKITFEYVMLKGVNDKPEQAKKLVKLLKDVPAKVNLIPFNPFPLTDYERSTPEAISIFQDILTNSGIHTFVRKTRGDEIDAACGQLAGEVKDKTRRASTWQKMQFQKNFKKEASSTTE